jgi:hypothetical protein
MLEMLALWQAKPACKCLAVQLLKVYEHEARGIGISGSRHGPAAISRFFRAPTNQTTPLGCPKCAKNLATTSMGLLAGHFMAKKADSENISVGD